MCMLHNCRTRLFWSQHQHPWHCMCPDNDIIVTFVADKEFIYEYYDTAFARILIIVNNK